MSVIISIHFNWYVRETIKANNRNAIEENRGTNKTEIFFVCFVQQTIDIAMCIAFKTIGPKVFAI